MTRPPWCSPLDDPRDATARLLARLAGTTTHAEAAERCGVSLRTMLRWWAVLGALVAAGELRAEDLPPRVAGGTSERTALAVSRRRAKRGYAKPATP